jgi:hypothetical protein
VTTLNEYANKYQIAKIERRGGILQVTLHTNGGPLQWGNVPHEELPQVFRDIGSDRENRVVIMTGTGNAFSGPRGSAQGQRPGAAQEDPPGVGQDLLGR